MPYHVVEKSHLVKGTGNIPETVSTKPYNDYRITVFIMIISFGA